MTQAAAAKKINPSWNQSEAKKSNTIAIAPAPRELSPDKEEKVQARAKEMLANLFKTIEPMKTEFQAWAELEKKIERLEDKAGEYDQRIEKAEAGLKAAKEKLIETIEADKDPEKAITQVNKHVAEIEGLKTCKAHIKDTSLPGAEREYAQARQEFSQKISNLVRTARAGYSREINQKMVDYIEVDILSWDRALKTLRRELGISIGRIDLRLRHNRVVEGHIAPVSHRSDYALS